MKSLSLMKAPCATLAKFFRERDGHRAVQQAVHKVQGELVIVSHDVVVVASLCRAAMAQPNSLRVNASNNNKRFNKAAIGTFSVIGHRQVN